MKYFIYEADRFGGKKRSDLKDSDFVDPDKRAFPIMSSQDVKDAVSSWGRYKGSLSFDQFKAKLTAIAKRKGYTTALPDSWKVKESTAMPPLKEVGKVLNKTNKSLLKQAWEALKNVLDTMPDESNSEDKDTKEAQGFSLNDLASALGRELGETRRNAYIADIFVEDSTCVYQQGWPQKYYQVDYTIDDTGVATFGDPVEVSRKVSYVPTSDNEPPMPSMSMESLDLSTTDAQVIPLVEKAVAPDDTVMLKIISEGWGSSGYYSADVIKKAINDRVWHKGLHNLIDHPTAQEEAARPEGSISNLGSTLIEDAHWLDDFKGNGAGAYARAKVVPQFKETLNAIANDIGTSIRAKGKARIGEINGRKGPIIESIDRALSVDYVTLPGRGGKVIELMESVRGNSMTIDETVLKELRETNQKLTEQVMRLNEARLRDTARVLLDRGLQAYTTLSRATKERIRSAMDRIELPLTESSELDATKYNEALKDAVGKEVAYLADLGVGHVKNAGSTGDPTATGKDDEYTYEKFSESLKALD